MNEWPASEKYTHAEVRYSEGRGDEQCGKCRHFIAPNRCEHVASPIDTNDWCRLFAPKTVKLSAMAR